MSDLMVKLNNNGVNQHSPEVNRNRFDVCLYADEIINGLEPNLDALPNEYWASTESDDALCEQLAIPNGLHTCTMTSAVNAFISQGWISGVQGKNVHDEFPERTADRLFTEKILDGKKVKITHWEDHLIRKITGENLFTATLSQIGSPREKTIGRVITALANDIVLTVGNERHTRLAIGYSNIIDPKLHTVDPYKPEEIITLPIDEALIFHDAVSLLAVAPKQKSLAYKPEIPFPVKN